ncbi:MAG: PAS domain S-box protein [Calditrichia bacterium]
MNRIKLNHIIFFVFILALVIITASSFMSYRTNFTLANSVQRTDDKYDFLLSLKSILSDLQDTETGVRGYVLTGEDEYLLPYQNAVAAIDREFKRLQSYSEESMINSRTIDTLDALAARKLAFQRKVIDIRRTGGFNAARAMILTDQGKMIMDSVRAVVARVQSNEKEFLARNLQQSHSIAYGENVQDGAATAFSLILFIFAFILFTLRVNERKKNIAELREANEKFHLLVNGAKDYALFLLDKAGKVVGWNDGAEHLKGFREAEIAGQHFSRFYTAEDIETGKPEYALKKAAESGSFEEEGWRLRKDGSRFWASVLITPLRDSRDNLTGYAKLTRDLTEKRETEGTLQIRAEQQALVAELGQKALEGGEIEHLMEEISYMVSDIMNVDTCNTWEYLPQENALQFRKGVGWTETSLQPADGNSQVAFTFRSAMPVLAENLQTEERFKDDRLMKDHRIMSFLSVAIAGPDTPYGVLGVYHRKERRFSRDDVNFLLSVANVLATAIGRKKAEEDLQVKDSAVESSLNAIALADLQGNLSYVNPAFLEIWGYDSPDEVLGRDSTGFWANPEQALGVIEILKSQGYWKGELKARRKNKSVFDALLTTSVVKNKNGKIISILGSFIDISDRKMYEEALRKANRALRTISEFNQALVRIFDEQELLDYLCKVIIEVGGYRLAWVGFAEHDAQRSIRPVAQVGFESGYLETLRLTWADSERGRGPAGTSIRTGQPVISQNLLVDPNFAPWREAALRRGFAATISLPLFLNDEVLGNLNIYATEVNAFDQEEIDLLIEMADDLSYGISALRTRAEHRQAEQALQESEKRYHTLFEDSPVPLAEEDFSRVKEYMDRLSTANMEDVEKYLEENPRIVDEMISLIRITDVNQALLKLLEIEDKQLILSGVNEYISPEEYASFIGEFTGIYGKKSHLELEGTIRTSSGTPLNVLINWQVVPGHEEDFSKVLVSLVDITARKKAERALQLSEARYRGLLESAPDGIMIFDGEGRLLLMNAQAEKMFGYRQEEMIGQTANSFVPDMLHRRHSRHQSNYLKNPQVMFLGNGRELVSIRKDGTVFPVEMSLSPLQSENDLLITAIIRDISQRKEAESRLKKSEEDLRKLSMSLLTVREEERKFIAQEIHDELGQQLTGMKIDLYWMKSKLEKLDCLQAEQRLKDKMHFMLDMIDATIKTVRRIATQLRPTLLDDAGLIGAIEWHAKEFSNRTGIQCRLSAPPEDIAFDKEQSIAVFRIFQESLTNVARHAGANRVDVIIKKRKNRFNLRIKDNGRGITAEDIEKSRSLGLVGIRERSIALGGKADISGKPGRGTIVAVEIPLKKPVK